MPGWLGKHPKHKLFMIQSSLLQSQTWRRLRIKDIKPTALNCVRHPFNLAVSFPPCASRAASGWVLMLSQHSGALCPSPSSCLGYSHGILLCAFEQRILLLLVRSHEAELEMLTGLLRTLFPLWSLPELDSQSLLSGIGRDEVKVFNLMINF